MTITFFYQKVQIGGSIFWMQRYQDKGAKQPFWRYGEEIGGFQYIYKQNLINKPNLKRLFGKYMDYKVIETRKFNK